VIGEFRPLPGLLPHFRDRFLPGLFFTAAGLAVAAGLVRAFAKPARRGEEAPAEGFDVGALVFAVTLG
jgi:hypothetical protein